MIKKINSPVEFIIILLLVTMSFFLAGGFTNPSSPLPSDTVYTLVTQPPARANYTLQIGTLQFTTIIPLQPTVPPQTSNPGKTYQPPRSGKCTADGPVSACSQCCGGSGCGSGCGYGGPYGKKGECSKTWCDAEPILYLYTKKQTTVGVKLSVPGTIIASNPHYPTETGWTDITAFPDGHFLYQKKTYHELFYEASLTPAVPPETGIVIPISNLQQTLQIVTTRLGYLPSEQQELLTYWLPRLQALHAPYLLVSYFSPEEKERIDGVTISPKPDTFIQFILYFKPLQSPVTISPLVLPQSPPQRRGFAAVEWGGIVDTLPSSTLH